ncbi:MAG: hypothetical protein ACE5I8_11865 [Thermodesulfobacteriota bacterium]
MTWKGYFQSAGWLNENHEPTNNITIWYTEEIEISQVNDKDTVYRIATIVRSSPKLIRVEGEMEVVYRLGDVFFIVGDYVRDSDSIVSLVYKPEVYFCYYPEDDSRLSMSPQEIEFHRSATQKALSMHPFGNVLQDIYLGQEKSKVYYLNLLHRN